jgi:hypothetical protein
MPWSVSWAIRFPAVKEEGASAIFELAIQIFDTFPISKIEKNTYTQMLYEVCKILLKLTYPNVRSNIIFKILS